MNKNKLILIAEDFLALVTVFSLASIAAETVPDLREYSNIFHKIEIAVVSIFVIEYIVRLLTSKHKIKYIFSFYGIADILSILPTLLGFGNFVFLKSLRVIRISRLFRMLRVFKFSQVANDIESRLKKEQEIDFFFYFKALFTFTVLFGGLIYIFEFHNYPLADLPKSFNWAFQLLLGITPLVEPYTIAGEVVEIMTKFAGFILLALLIYLLREFIMKTFYKDF
jgi:voltage-gated potassium channel